MDEDAPKTDTVLIDSLRRLEGGEVDLESECALHPELAEALRGGALAMERLKACGGAHAPVPPRLGRFEVLAEIGRGGSGIVYRARDPLLDRVLALKLLPPGFGGTPESSERFRREARALARINHPNIVAVHEVAETQEGLPFIVMTLVEGRSLEEVLRGLAGRDPATLHTEDLLPHPADRNLHAASFVEALVRVFAVLADALDHAHRAGVVHRDLKPGNVMLDAMGSPHLVDFGLALAAETSRMTRTGTTPGTPIYMAPEQISGSREQQGPQTDVYGLGATLYHGLTLSAPFQGTTTAQIFDAICRREPVLLRKRNSAVPRDLETIVAKAMEKDPGRRYASAAQLREDLEALLALRPIRARVSGPVTRSTRWVRRNPALSALGVLGVGTFLLLAVWAQSITSERREGRRAFLRFQELEAELAGTEASLEPARLFEFLDEDERGRIAEGERRAEELRVVAESQLARACESFERALASTRWLGHLNGGLERELFDALLLRSEYAKRRHSPLEASRYNATAIELARDRAARWYSSRVLLACTTEGARAHLFRYEPYESLRAEAVPRLVPVPVRPNGEAIAFPDAAFQPGDLCLEILRVESGSPAQREGLAAGDLIHRVGGRSVRDPGLFVGVVVPGGLAEQSGVRPFDRLVSVRMDQETKEGALSAVTPMRSWWDWETLPAWDWVGGVPVIECTTEDSRGRQSVLRTELRVERIDGMFPEVTPTRSYVAQVAEGNAGPRALEDVLGLELAEAHELLAEPPPDELRIDCWSSGGMRQIPMPGGTAPGIVAEPCAYPMVRLADNRIELSGEIELHLPPGSYVFLVEAPDHAPLRLPYLLERDSTVRLHAQPLRPVEIPEGYLYVPPGDFVFQGEADVSLPGPREVLRGEGFFISRLEVSLGEWLQYANDPETPIVAAELLDTLVPAHRGLSEAWHILGEKGSWRPDGLLTRDSPGLAPTPAAVENFLAWKNRRAAGFGWRYRLATPEEWEHAARGADGRSYPWGDRFDFSLCSSHFARGVEQLDMLRLEPRGRFPTDESPYGVRDMAGSVAELNEGSPRPNLPQWQSMRGGSWVSVNPAQFKAASQVIHHADVPDRGFRLVAERE